MTNNILNDGLIEWMGKHVDVVTNAISLCAVFIICIVLKLFVKFLITKVVKHMKSEWFEIFYKNKLFQRISNFTVPVVISAYVYSLPEYNEFIGKAVGTINVVFCAMFINSISNVVNEIYCQYEISKVRPIRGTIQVIAVAAYIVSGITVVAILMGESPTVLIGGIGAMTAVISIVFKDSILGFVAGLQLVGNDMIHIGDWIEVPKYSANGIVTDLSVTTVKVQNFDCTITSIPAYTLISDSFINMRGMINSGGRRIKRAICIDASTIKLCDNQMIEKFRNIFLITDYINLKIEEMTVYNKENNVVESQAVNAMQITNIGVFRIYILEYLKKHPNIRKDMPLLVRQTEPGESGVPLELYCFTDTTVLAEYEGIQSDIFEHIYSVVSEFELRIYQKPSSSDFCRNMSV